MLFWCVTVGQSHSRRRSISRSRSRSRSRSHRSRSSGRDRRHKCRNTSSIVRRKILQEKLERLERIRSELQSSSNSADTQPRTRLSPSGHSSCEVRSTLPDRHSPSPSCRNRSHTRDGDDTSRGSLVGSGADRTPSSPVPQSSHIVPYSRPSPQPLPLPEQAAPPLMKQMLYSFSATFCTDMYAQRLPFFDPVPREPPRRLPPPHQPGMIPPLLHPNLFRGPFPAEPPRRPPADFHMHGWPDPFFGPVPHEPLGRLPPPHQPGMMPPLLNVQQNAFHDPFLAEPPRRLPADLHMGGQPDPFSGPVSGDPPIPPLLPLLDFYRKRPSEVPVACPPSSCASTVPKSTSVGATTSDNTHSQTSTSSASCFSADNTNRSQDTEKASPTVNSSTSVSADVTAATLSNVQDAQPNAFCDPLPAEPPTQPCERKRKRKRKRKLLVVPFARPPSSCASTVPKSTSVDAATSDSTHSQTSTSSASCILADNTNRYQDTEKASPTVNSSTSVSADVTAATLSNVQDAQPNAFCDPLPAEPPTQPCERKRKRKRKRKQPVVPVARTLPAVISVVPESTSVDATTSDSTHSETSTSSASCISADNTNRSQDTEKASTTLDSATSVSADVTAAALGSVQDVCAPSVTVTAVTSSSKR